MRFTLKDYQADATQDVLAELNSARDLFHAARSRVSSVALTATTGAGKTVTAAAVIESLFFGNDELDMAEDPGAVVLWFSDDPSLNAQTKLRLEQASDRLRNRLVTVEHPFRYRKLQAGNVYFLNTSKLSTNSLLVRRRDEQTVLEGIASNPDLIPFTIWDTIQATIEDPRLTLYMVLDEAHRGMSNRSSDEKPTIVRRLINGHNGVPPVPVVWGISATVARFEDAMRSAEVQDTRIHLRTIAVDPIRIQESGLLKDDIVLDFPAETGDFNTVLLRRGVRKVMAMTAAWEEYARTQNEAEPVVPLMVLQVPNRPESQQMESALDVIFDEWSDLSSDAIAHVFGDHTPQTYGRYSVPYISPERVQDAKHIRVLLAKDAISTGWDCPRAEVMVSFRPAVDETHITQLLGRMIRTPLARRIEGNDILNTVECILPRFDRTTASSVLEKLLGSNDVGPGNGNGPRVLIDPVVMAPNPQIDDSVWEAFGTMATEGLPRKNANPIKRLTALAHALATDGLVPEGGRIAHERLHGVFAGLSAQYATELATAVDEVLTVRGGTVRASAQHGLRTDGSFTEVADDRAIMEAYRQGGRVVTPDVARTYVESLAANGDEDDVRDAYVRVAALSTLPQVRPALDSEADATVVAWLAQHRVAIKSLPEARQSLYAEITAMSTEPQPVDMAMPKNRQEPSRTLVNGQISDVPWRPRHLLSTEEGQFPVAKLNPDELAVLDQELLRDDLLGWYRNPTGGRDALGIAYQDARGDWRMLRPDFVFFTRTSDGVKPSVVDPHGAWLPDSLSKLRGMARFAVAHAGEFHRLESVSRIEGELRVLDFTSPEVQAAVADAADADSVYRSAGVAY